MLCIILKKLFYKICFYKLPQVSAFSCEDSCDCDDEEFTMDALVPGEGESEAAAVSSIIFMTLVMRGKNLSIFLKWNFPISFILIFVVYLDKLLLYNINIAFSADLLKLSIHESVGVFTAAKFDEGVEITEHKNDCYSIRSDYKEIPISISSLYKCHVLYIL